MRTAFGRSRGALCRAGPSDDENGIGTDRAQAAIMPSDVVIAELRQTLHRLAEEVADQPTVAAALRRFARRLIQVGGAPGEPARALSR